MGPKKNIIENKQNGVKNAEYYADFRSAKIITKNSLPKSYEQNSQLKVHFLAFTHTLF